MSDLITPDDLPKWVPGETTVDSVRLGWEGVRTRGYRYSPLDVPIPAMREYMRSDDDESTNHRGLAQ
jgi:AraC family transcriptional regulator